MLNKNVEQFYFGRNGLNLYQKKNNLTIIFGKASVLISNQKKKQLIFAALTSDPRILGSNNSPREAGIGVGNKFKFTEWIM